MIKRQKLTNITALLTIASIIAGTLFLERAEKTRLHQERRSFALNQTSSFRAKLEGIINSTLLLTRGVVAHVATHPDITVPEFHMLAKELLPLNPHIRNIGLARDNVITHMYPIKGNEAAIGLRYLDNPKQKAAVLRVIETRKTVVAGPVNLVQGGLGFISRTPVFLTPPGAEPGSGEYWGIASMVINADTLLEEAGLSTDLSSGLTIALRGKDGLGERGDVFFGDETVFRSDPVLLDVALPEGSWQIAAIPAEGWDVASSRIGLFRFAAFLISIILGTMIWMFGRLSDEIVLRKTEEAVAESDRKAKTKFEEIITTSPAVTYSCSIENNKIIPIFVSNNLEDYFGYKERDFKEDAEWWVNNIHPGNRELTINEFSEALFHSSKDRFTHEYRFKNKKGAYIWIRDELNIMRDEKEAPIKIVGSWMDITDRKLMEETLRKSENGLKQSQEQLRAIIDNSTAVIYLKDIDGQYLLINKQYEKLFNISENEIIGKTDYEVFPKEVADQFRNNDLSIIKTKMPEEYEESVPHNDGLHTYISIKFPICDAQGEVYGVCGISTDITTRKKMEEEIAKSQKLESIGLLAGGIAHDFNNILAIILNNISFVEKQDGLEDKVVNNLKDVRNMIVHGKGLTQQLLTFSRGGAPIRTTTSISLLLKDSISLFLSGSNIKCELSTPYDLWPAEVDEGQIGQVINNLIINAEQAMPNGGTLEVLAENVELNADDTIPLQDGRYLKISVRDQGIGISEGNIKKMFDPYFTTKEGGTGLGLTTTYSIIKKHDGHIEVCSELGMGTTFTIYLPASDKELVLEDKVPQKTDGIKWKVLLMEDDVRLGKVVVSLLEDSGYKVELAIDGSEAIDIFKTARASNQSFDAVLLDLTVPGGMGGKETIKRLIEIDPNVKAIVTSGYSNDSVMSNFKDYGFSGVIPKPYDVEELSEKLNEILVRSDK